MNIREVARELCKREGKKKQVDIAQMSETLGALSDLIHAQGPIIVEAGAKCQLSMGKTVGFHFKNRNSVIDCLVKNGMRRAKT